jgi:hypothetical protein
LNDLASVWIMGFKNETFTNGYFLSSIFNNYSIPSIGYFEGYQFYLTSGIVRYAGTIPSFVTYNKFGSIPSSISFPNKTLSLSSKGLNSFDFSFNSSYTFRVNNWYYEETLPKSKFFSWYVHGDVAAQKFNLPTELTSKYDFLKIEKLQYSASQFTQCLDGKLYKDHITEFFSGGQVLKEFYRYGF